VGIHQLDCATGKLAERLRADQCSFDLPENAPSRLMSNTAPVANMAQSTEKSSPMKIPKKKTVVKKKYKTPKTSRHRRETLDKLPHDLESDIILICRTLWSIFLPQGTPDALKYDSATINNQAVVPSTSMANIPHRQMDHPVFWCHPQHQTLPNHCLVPHHTNSGTVTSLIAGVDLRRRAGRSFSEFGKSGMENCQEITLYEMVNRVVAAGPEAVEYLCEHFESRFIDGEDSGEGDDVVHVLNDLLAAAHQYKHATMCLGNDPILMQHDLGTESFHIPKISSLFSACMTRTLQVYMSHPNFIAQLPSNCKTDNDSSDRSDDFQTFFTNLALLREYPVSLISDVHRELHVKKLIKRRATDNYIKQVSMENAHVLSGGFELNANSFLFISSDPAVHMYVGLLESSMTMTRVMLTHIGPLRIHKTAIPVEDPLNTLTHGRKNGWLDSLKSQHSSFFDTECNCVSSTELMMMCHVLKSSLSTDRQRVHVDDDTSSSGLAGKKRKVRSSVVLISQEVEKKARGVEDAKPTEKDASLEITENVIQSFDLSLRSNQSTSSNMEHDPPESHSLTKIVGAVHSNSYGSDVFNTVSLNLNLAEEDMDADTSIFTNAVQEVTSSDSSKKMTGTAVKEIVNSAISSCLVEACRSTEGAYFRDIVNHFLTQAMTQKTDATLTLDLKLHQFFTYDIHLQANRTALEIDIGKALDVLTRPRGLQQRQGPLLYEIPVFSAQYEQQLDLRFFVTSTNVHLYSVNTSTIEGCCPWMATPAPPVTLESLTSSSAASASSASVLANNPQRSTSDPPGRNERVYFYFVAKIMAVLMRQPSSSAPQLHAEVRVFLNITQLCILLQTMLESDLVICVNANEEKDGSANLVRTDDLFSSEKNFFQRIDNTAQESRSFLSTLDSTDEGKQCVSFRGKRFSIKSKLSKI